jgi:hypothetical protein
MSWRDDVRRELERATEAERAGNAGRVRTCARRAVGFAITEWQRRDPAAVSGDDFLRQIRALSVEPAVPTGVREAAERLGAKLGEDFRSRSTTPLADASTVLDYVLGRMGESPVLS